MAVRNNLAHPPRRIRVQKTVQVVCVSRQRHSYIRASIKTQPSPFNSNPHFSQNCFGDVSSLAVNGTAPSSVIRNVCSNWAVRLPSEVVAVHLSGHITFLSIQQNEDTSGTDSSILAMSKVRAARNQNGDGERNINPGMAGIRAHRCKPVR